MTFDYSSQVVGQRQCGPNLYWLTLETEPGSPAFACQPGQFVMLDLPTDNFMFRRPFSVISTDGHGRIDLFYKVVGQGTQAMSAFADGQRLKVLGPLGHGFVPESQPHEWLLVGGGIGIAPMYFLAERVRPLTDLSPLLAYGVRSKPEVGIFPELMQVIDPERLLLSTDDGTFGLHGNVCQLLATQERLIRETIREAFICGPTPMMAAVVRQLRELNPEIRVYVSLENHMPCGTGACFGCVVLPQGDSALPVRACTEGPVFKADALVWDDRGPVNTWEQTECQRACST